MLTPEESRVFIDEMARELLGISWDEFVRRYHAGRYGDILDGPEHTDLMCLVMLGGLRTEKRVTEVSVMALRQPREAVAQAGLDAVETSAYALPPVRRLTREQSRVYFDETARELLGISGETFVERWHAGRYDDILDDPAHSDIMYLTLLGNIGRTR